MLTKLLTRTKPKTGSLSPEINVPESWNSLSRKQLLLIIRLFSFNLDITSYRVIALNRLACIKVTGNSHYQEETDRWLFEIKHRRQKHWVTAGLYHQLLKAMNFITEAPTLTNQLIPRFSLLPLPLPLPLPFSYYGPDEACYNINYNELIHAQLAYTNYTNTKKLEYLNQLVAVLYRPRKKNVNKNSPQWDGDMREPFSAYNYQRRAKLFKLLPYRVKYAIYIFYSGSLALMEKEHPLCFQKSTRISSTPKQHNPAKELIDLVPVITKADPTKNKEIYITPAWDVFDAYESARREFEATKPKK
jgi:hypothetical protein